MGVESDERLRAFEQRGARTRRIGSRTRAAYAGRWSTLPSHLCNNPAAALGVGEAAEDVGA